MKTKKRLRTIDICSELKKRKTRKKKAKPKVENLKPKSEKELSLARKIAHAFKSEIKAKNIYAQPWGLHKPVEDQPVFRFFILAARIVESTKLDPREYVRAQFKCWNGPSYVLPAPSQLVSEGAMVRYNNYMQELQESGVLSRRAEKKADPFKYDRLIMARYTHCHADWSRKEILCEFADEFSQTYLEQEGVWSKVKEEWQRSNPDC